MNKESGFNMVEVMIVVSIITILTAIGTLSYLSMRPTLRLSGSARQVMGDLMAARMKAVSQNNHFRVFFLNNQEYQIHDDDDSDGSVDAGESTQTINIQDNYPGITFNATSNPSFSPKGTTVANTTITIANTTGSKSVTVRASGQIKIN